VTASSDLDPVVLIEVELATVTAARLAYV